MADYDVVVVGSGPGGYVAAIRAAQLGMKAAVVERAEVGGVCLNWGCIPTKALLRNAEVLSLFRHAADFGISVDNLTHDFGMAIDRSREVVKKLTDGVGFLLRRNKVELVEGTGVLKDRNTVAVSTDRFLSTDNVIVATGARPRDIAALPVDGKVVMVRRIQEPSIGRWAFPAGFVDLGESVGDAAAREMEVGMEDGPGVRPPGPISSEALAASRGSRTEQLRKQQKPSFF